MPVNNLRILGFILLGAVAGEAIKTCQHVHADPTPALDRQLVERMTRALEAQAKATQELVRATERCKR